MKKTTSSLSPLIKVALPAAAAAAVGVAMFGGSSHSRSRSTRKSPQTTAAPLPVPAPAAMAPAHDPLFAFSAPPARNTALAVKPAAKMAPGSTLPEQPFPWRTHAKSRASGALHNWLHDGAGLLGKPGLAGHCSSNICTSNSNACVTDTDCNGSPVVHGHCGTSGLGTFTGPPTTGLCSTGSPTGVTTTSTNYSWTCNGSNGGATSPCTATRHYAITTSVIGSNGSISASQTVPYLATPSITATPSGGYATTFGGTCGGTPSGNSYTVTSVTSSCTVTASFALANTAPSFVTAGAGSLTVAQAASATDIKSLLHVSDSDASQTEMWTPIVSPSHGTLSISGATASSGSGSTDITPGGTMTYTPTASYVGPDTFTIEVSDSFNFATRVINVTVGSARTVSVNALSLNAMTVNTAFTSQSFSGAGGYGSYTYSVDAGSLPAGLSLNTSTGALTGTPTSAGAYNFTIRATDSSTGTGPFSGTRTFSGTVMANGACGPANGAAIAYAPAAANLCSAGTASGVTAGSPWSWTCAGSGGGSTASCSAPNASTATGSGNGRMEITNSTGGTAWQVQSASFGSVASTGSAAPAGYSFPHGLLNLRLDTGTLGSSATITTTYPTNLPTGSVYWKYGKTAANPVAHWYQYPGAVISGNTVTLTLTDGGAGDDDLSPNRVIVDPGGVGAPLVAGGATGIPTLSQWGQILLSAMLALFGLAGIHRRKKPRN